MPPRPTDHGPIGSRRSRRAGLATPPTAAASKQRHAVEASSTAAMGRLRLLPVPEPAAFAVLAPVAVLVLLLGHGHAHGSARTTPTAVGGTATTHGAGTTAAAGAQAGVGCPATHSTRVSTLPRYSYNGSSPLTYIVCEDLSSRIWGVANGF